ncbi:hypothetical protein [Sphingomonas sp. LY160]|uniref:hypothetical protein n=1 Tax=Sphingomonas sp. LY160 TaxID=3095342 RepID=UPI002ADEB61B|nr:hypothetical protein [Sphingomonas sp. LY160]MEA1071207.1 hypothetical protein [Sphingomonas sp. LY160]
MTANQSNRTDTKAGSAKPATIRDRTEDLIDGARERAIDAYDSARSSASAAKAKTKEGIGEAPLLALGGGLALGALIAAFLPKTRAEDKLLGNVGGRISDTARAAVDAAKEAGKGKLEELNLTKDAGSDAIQSILKGIGEAAKTSGQAALGTVRKTD